MMWFAAAAPIAVVLALMVGLRWGATKAGPAGWVVSLLVAATVFGAGPKLLLLSQGKAVVRSMFVLYIIWLALALYNVVSEAGALDAIGAGMSRLTADRTMQLLILAWVFSSFLQGVTGFGVPVAVVAPMLVGLGFPPLASVVATGVAHGWAVTFGSLASSFYAMLAVTGMDGADLAPWTAALLGLACLPCGMVAAAMHQGRRSVAHALPAILVLWVVMAGTQYALAVAGLWSMAAFGAGIAGLVASAAVVRMGRYRAAAMGPTAPGSDSAGGVGSSVGHPTATGAGEGGGMGFFEAMSAYFVLLAVVVVGGLVGPVRDALDTVSYTATFPETQTSLGWVNEAAAERALHVFGHAGALILYTCAFAFAIYWLRGRYEPGAAARVVAATIRGSIKPTIGILFMVGMAMFMADSGMTYALALGISRGLGFAFPVVSPFIGALGAFVTGSNTNSNVLFAGLQEGTATLLGLNVLLLLGAQNLGGAVGSVFAPAKVIVGCSTVGLAGCEGDALRQILVYGLAIVALGSVVVGVISLLP